LVCRLQFGADDRRIVEGGTMARKRALCVGVSDWPFEDSDLAGCVNDAEAWAALEGSAANKKRQRFV
jgi:hypothetical protein